MDKRITHAQISSVRTVLSKGQDNVCPLCKKLFTGRDGKTAALDHDHVTGSIRGVLCIWCNGREGKVFNLARTACKDDPVGWIVRLAEYLVKHKLSQHGLMHPTHKTAVEKRLARNAKARAKRKSLK